MSPHWQSKKGHPLLLFLLPAHYSHPPSPSCPGSGRGLAVLFEPCPFIFGVSGQFSHPW